jgi:hypothetical protein
MKPLSGKNNDVLSIISTRRFSSFYIFTKHGRLSPGKVKALSICFGGVR